MAGGGGAGYVALPSATPPREAARAVDPVSRQWIAQLRAGGRERDQATAALHALLVKAARFTLAKRCGPRPQVGRETIDDLAFEAAGDALVAILARLGDYRGESRFTTWAWKFAVLEASVALRRRNWTSRETPIDDDGWALLGGGEAPEHQLEQRELLRSLKRGIEEHLTAHQKMVFVAVALNAVPVDVLAERLGTSRGALYKTLHDARRKLRAQLPLD